MGSKRICGVAGGEQPRELRLAGGAGGDRARSRRAAPNSGPSCRNLRFGSETRGAHAVHVFLPEIRLRSERVVRPAAELEVIVRVRSSESVSMAMM
jgi:hypothetical protein